MVEARHLRKEFTNTVAVDDVSFDLKGGEIFGLLGPNGAGKTTTIRMLLNIIPPDAGYVSYDGKPFSGLHRGDFGYLPEERGLYRKSRVIHVTTYFGELRGLSRETARKSSFEWLERFGMSGTSGRRVEELSKGNQQKLQLIVALLHDPSIVILDEPSSGLDPVNQNLLHEVLLEQKRQGRVLILSTHQMDQAEKLCDRICLINHGRVVLDGPLPSIRKKFSRNTIRVEFSGDGSVIPTIRGTADVSLEGDAAEITLQPGVLPSYVLRELTARLDVHRFEIQEPTLHSIFLRAVGDSVNAGS
jgi:ABC-2 type transport system ATP-binding protein